MMLDTPIYNLKRPTFFCIVESDHPFAISVSGTVNGCLTSQCKLEDDPSDVKAVDIFGDLGVYAGRQGAGDYCSSEYLIEKGTFKDDSDNECTAYKVHPPASKAKSFEASRTFLMFKFFDNLNLTHSLIEYKPSTFGKPAYFSILEEINPTVAGQYERTQESINSLTEPKIFCVVSNEHAFANSNISFVDGCSTSQCDLENDPNIVEYVDRFRDVGVYAARNGGTGSCNTGSDYCSSGYFIEKGDIEDDTGNKFTAYKVHPPVFLAANHLHSPTQLMFKFDKMVASGYAVFRYYPRNLSYGNDGLSVEDYVYPTTVDQYVRT